MIKLLKRLRRLWRQPSWKEITIGTLVLVVVLLASLYPLYADLRARYAGFVSLAIYDRSGERIAIQPNTRGNYATEAEKLPPRLVQLLLAKEDRWFYYHPGINPFSIIRDAGQAILTRKLQGSSTLTQQTVKVLLQHENQRSLGAKILEVPYALALGLFASKEQVLKMYTTIAPFGNQAQGFAEASRYYFGQAPAVLSDMQTLSLLAALNNPSSRFPSSPKNEAFLPHLATSLGVPLTDLPKAYPGKFKRVENSAFDVTGVAPKCAGSCTLTIDSKLTESLRSLLRRELDSPWLQGVKNGAIIVIKVPHSPPPPYPRGSQRELDFAPLPRKASPRGELTSPYKGEEGLTNELLAVVGSPNPRSDAEGQQINMAIAPRPVGSTVKPFIYSEAFARGARPYTLVDDREYRYTIGTGFGFYPKNYDGQYRGLVTLHQALANSLNVPAVKTLEFAGLENFQKFLTGELNFHPRQPLESYGLGIALGGLEVDPLTFTNWFTAFPTSGVLRPLIIVKGEGTDYSPPYPRGSQRGSVLPLKGGVRGGIPLPSSPVRGGIDTRATLRMSDNVAENKTVLAPELTQLATRILSDRATGVDQFGAAGNLYLTIKNYAVKTGTTYDYHDSWTVGYTPDLVVGVWLGNSDNSPVRQLSGQAGAGRVWHDVMELLLATPYYTATPFDFSRLATYTDSGTLEYGLPNDNYAEARQIMLGNDLILSPHNGDEFLLEPKTVIPLKAREAVKWSVDGKLLQAGTEAVLKPTEAKEYVIAAENSEGKKQEIKIRVNTEE